MICGSIRPGKQTVPYSFLYHLTTMAEFQRNTNEVWERSCEGVEHPSILLHSCCAPCSSHVIELLCDRFELTIFYYNPNIYPDKEYAKRKSEQISANLLRLRFQYATSLEVTAHT